jgi:hypothetical protein
MVLPRCILRHKMLGQVSEQMHRQVVALEQMAAVRERLFRDRVAAADGTHRLDIVGHLLGARIRPRGPLLQALDVQHHGERTRQPNAPRMRLHGNNKRICLRDLRAQ